MSPSSDSNSPSTPSRPIDRTAMGDETTNALRIILMGTGPFAVPSFEAIREAGHDILLVVTRPIPPTKSRKGAPPAPVRDWATEHGLPLIDPPSINEGEVIQQLFSQNADLMVVCDYGQILKPDALSASRLGGINLHGSLLPAYRGAAPVQRSLLSGDAVTGVSVIHMTPRLDGGPVLTTRETDIQADETAGELEERLSAIGVGATMEAVAILDEWDGDDDLIGQPQDASKVSKAPRLSKAEAEIDWSRSAKEIDCHVRGMQPWPIAFTHVQINEKKPPVRLAVKKVRVTTGAVGGAQPGELVEGEGLLIASGDMVIEIERLQPAGKREMSGEEFLRGHQLTPGLVLK